MRTRLKALIAFLEYSFILWLHSKLLVNAWIIDSILFIFVAFSSYLLSIFRLTTSESLIHEVMVYNDVRNLFHIVYKLLVR